MTIEPDTTPEEDVTDNDVDLSDDDIPEDLDFDDPEEIQDTEEEEELEGADDETDEVEAENEAEDQEAEDQTDENPADVTVTLDSGESVSLEELKSGYLRQADYTRKTQSNATERTALAEQAQLMQNVTDAFVQHMQSTLPPEPPMELMATDPQKHYLLSVQRQQAIGQIQNILQMADQPNQVANALSADDRRKQAVAENDKLVQMFPDAIGGESRKAFFSDVQGVAEQLGYSTEELNNVSDHRLFALAHWAKRGMDAEKAKATVKEKVKKAPPAKATKPGQSARKSQVRAKARERLLKDDSIENAVALLSD